MARLSDSDPFITAGESGLGIFEMDFAVTAAERQQFQPIVEWVDRLPVVPPTRVPVAATASRPGLRVIGSLTASQPGGFR